MFPKSFNARVAERMAIWGAMLGFLAFLYAATEVIQAWKLAKLSDDAQRASAALSANANAEAALARISSVGSGGPDQSRARDLDTFNASLTAITEAMPSPEIQSLAAEIRGRLAELRGASGGGR